MCPKSKNPDGTGILLEKNFLWMNIWKEHVSLSIPHQAVPSAENVLSQVSIVGRKTNLDLEVSWSYKGTFLQNLWKLEHLNISGVCWLFKIY